MDVDDGSTEEEPWLLRFDGACRRNPGPGGAGAALFSPDGSVVWTCSHYLPASTETNNTAEYTALLVGVQSARHHGAKRLLIEGDSNLVLAQVRGTFGCNNPKLRQLRNRVRYELRALRWHRLRHIDRKANAHADRLANRALDQRRTSVECGPHESGMDECSAPSSMPASSPEHQAPDRTRSADETDPDPDLAILDIEAEIAARDGGEVFPTLPIGPPARHPRLRLRQLGDDEHDAAAGALQTMAEAMTSRITDADSWTSCEGYISAIPDRIREALEQFTVTLPSPTTRTSHAARDR
ncbi:reverse transcriptase, partial [Phytophthora megakarya]